MRTKCPDCCYPEVVDNNACGCCEGIEIATPIPTANRPGLLKLVYRIGTHAGFLETMMARLSSHDYLELSGLTTRDGSDPSIALLDAWATVADVLTFYQERIANEGYLGTATERRSIMELARLVGYKLRPGVASSVFLAYTLDEKMEDEATIPAGSRVQSIPGPDELPQSFETSEDLKARAKWNNLKPRTEKPQNITLVNSIRISKIYLSSKNANLQANDPILLVFGEGVGDKVIRMVAEVNSDFDKDVIEVSLLEIPFLITFAIELLRDIVFKLNEKVKNADESDVNRFVPFRDTLHTLLESFSLGLYPPLGRSDFSHERIYSFLCMSRRRFYTLSLSPIITRIVNLESIKETIQTILVSALDKLLENSVIQHEFICLFRYVLRQLIPENTVESNCLKKLLAIIASIAQYLPLFSKFEMLFYDRKLNDEVIAFISDYLLPVAEGEQETALVTFLSWLEQVTINKDSAICDAVEPDITNLNILIESLLINPSIQPRNSTRLRRNLLEMFDNQSDSVSHTLKSIKPQLDKYLDLAWSNASVDTITSQLKSIHAMNLHAPLFGYNAPLLMGLKKNEDSNFPEIEYISVPDGDWDPSDENTHRFFLDNEYKKLKNGTNIVIRNNHYKTSLAAHVDQVINTQRSAYNINGKTAQVHLSRDWLRENEPLTMSVIRKTSVWIDTAELQLALEPAIEDVLGDCIELDRVYDDLDSGRWIIVNGERSDIKGTSGLKYVELAMLSHSSHVYDKNLPGDSPHTQLKLAEKLKYRFKRETVNIYGNVVKATHGETRHEVLGSGDGSKPLQSFQLKQFPLTHVAASNPTGVDSTLKVIVNDMQWHETDTLADLKETDRNFITTTDNEDKTAITFGNGKKGARLPTGVENIRAEYRNGIGKPGNVKADQISLLVDKPLGVKEAINPLRASGGADREKRELARKNAPLAVKALDRLVSVQDYEDFARTYAGIGKARAVEMNDGRQQIVHVTIAGADDIPIDETSDLFRNLRQALHDFGDPFQSIRLAVRELMMIVISARVHLLPDYQWEPVVLQVRQALLEAFGFEPRQLGQDVLLSEVISVMQAVRGVAYVDVDAFGGIPEKINDNGGRRLLTPDEISESVDCLSAQWTHEDMEAWCEGQTVDLECEKYAKCTKYGNIEKTKGVRQRLRVNLADLKDGVIRPAQLAFLTPDVPETLILNRIE